MTKQTSGDERSRRDFIKTGTLYVAPVIFTLQARPAFAQQGSPAVNPTGPGNSGSRGNNGVGNGVDPQPPGNPPMNDGPGTGPGNPGNQ